MKYEKSFLEKEILEYSKILFHFIDFEDDDFEIHKNISKKKDYPRMMGILFTLSRVYKNNFELNIAKNNILKLAEKIYKKSKEIDSEKIHIYTNLYYIRLLNNLNQDYKMIVKDLESLNPASIYSYSVSNYVFCSTYFECQDFKIIYPFSESIKNNCLNCFEYLIFSDKKYQRPAFHFSEISAWREKIPEYLYNEANKSMIEMFQRDLQRQESSSSGIAKCLEHFARVSDIENFEKGINFLKKNRNLAKYKNYSNPKYNIFSERLYTEYSTSQYIMLDTPAHLLSAYINFYENL